MPLNPSVQSLIANFAAQYAVYKDDAYNETQLRRDFLDKVIKALGWDVDNEQASSETFREVVHEDRLSIDGQSKAPDYCVQLGGRKLFYIEAKKPSVNISADAAPAHQVRRYGWTSNTRDTPMPVCLLSNFAEFAVYDTTVKPSPKDDAAAARIFYCRYDELETVNPKYGVTNWEYLYNLFSQEAVRKGSLERIAAAANKKGTQTVDDAFLEEIENWRGALAVNLALRNAGLSERLVNFAVQKTIDRIIFLRIAEDRGIESEHILKTIAGGKEVYKHLLNVFIAADEKYNSGLFHFHTEKNITEEPDTLTPSLVIDDKILKDIINTLYYPAPYEFAVLPADILGSIYERFLGKVIRLTAGHRAKVEEKPEVRKAGGVYYTPSYIVDYIVVHTIGEALKDKTPKTIGPFRVLDPACGSGSFLINAYQYLLDWYLRAYIAEPSAYKKQLVKMSAGSYKLTIQERKRILTAHIFGVDIDTQAVEVTKLSLLLKAVEGLSAQEIQKSLFHERVLPDLGGNIKCGNSLIGSDFYAQGTLGFTEEEQYKINAFDWEAEFPTAFKDGGFDVVIGNPPYVNIENLDTHVKNYFFSHYKTCQGRTDIYIPFIENNLAHLKDTGALSFIIPYSFTNQAYGGLLRKQLLEENHVKEIVDTSNYFVFTQAVVKNIILLVGKGKSADEKTRIVTYQSEADFLAKVYQEFSVKQSDFLSLKDCRFETKPVQNLLAIKDKILKESIPLSDIFFVAYGARLNHKTKQISKAHYIHTENTGTYKRFLEGKNIERYSFTQDGWLDYKPKEHYNSMFPELFENEKLVTIRIIKDVLRFAYDNQGFYNSHTVINCVRYDTLLGVSHPSVKKELSHIVIEKCKNYSYQYVLGVLNSRIASWYFTNFLSDGLNFYPNDVKAMPIPALDMSNPKDKDRHDKLAALVEEMLALKKREAAEVLPQARTVIQRQIAALDRRIDAAVYALYGLTEEEIAVVEGER